jgi:hypothetical protein
MDIRRLSAIEDGDAKRLQKYLWAWRLLTSIEEQ